ncbi:MAG: Peroxide stress regulator / Ferric uptake regulation protein [uncultured Sulfurovum sp.]|uniref:Peroxide stress regulator / Ferric uptake regulation protein n=1 Tax=uncultured Sulfurovum sp. TaxID=269237 RepID=A0A6S6SIN0_9BACT|nr:MAG: Peroxide stress regulator / Ferric uptake regulation protein [uncultured Sulfurovum sp.]
MKIEELIKDKNIKLTSARLKLLQILEVADKPLCYEEIKRDISMDKATFYRNISKFEEEGILNAFESNDKKRYFEVKQNAHAHFVCIVCNSVECIKNIEINLPKYEINNVIINGKCPSCATSV